jgi:hypothetical protein
LQTRAHALVLKGRYNTVRRVAHLKKYQNLPKVLFGGELECTILLFFSTR